jgi:ribosomal protein S18 acetylase RimI-like enzyme
MINGVWAMIKRIYRIEEVFDFVWELSQNDFYAGYPRKKSMTEIKESIERAIHANSENIIACYHQNVLCGVGIYHWDCDEKYAQTTQFLIRGDYDKIADEIIGYISDQLPGYSLFIPVPFTNKNANEYFKKRNIECIDAHIDTRLYNLESHMKQKHDCVEKITKDNFEEYAMFHDKYAIPLEMYYNSKNLLKDMERFQILVFRKDDDICGSIFVKIVRDIAEVFGLFVDEEYKNKGIESILINEMIMQLYNEFRTVKELLYFVDEDSTDELNIVLSAGFVIKGRPRTYKYML